MAIGHERTDSLAQRAAATQPHDVWLGIRGFSVRSGGEPVPPRFPLPAKPHQAPHTRILAVNGSRWLGGHPTRTSDGPQPCRTSTRRETVLQDAVPPLG